MQGRLPGSICGQRLTDHLGDNPPLRTPGPLGHTDAHDPNLPGGPGDSPGPLGLDDYAEASAAEPPRWLTNRSPAVPPLSAQLDLNALGELITRHEGRRAKVYTDSRGRLVVGVGSPLDRPESRHRLKSLGLDHAAVRSGQQQLTEKQINTLFDLDLRDAVRAAGKVVPTLGDLPEKKQRVVIAMVFDLGADGLRQFKGLLAALEEQDYEKAAQEMEHALWFSQEGPRAKELVALMREDDFGRAAVNGALPRHQRRPPGRERSARHTGQPPTFSAIRPRFEDD